MTLKTKILSGITSGAVIAGLLLPSGAFAATNSVTISGNGAGSHNVALVVNKDKNKVKQTNLTAVVNLVGVIQNTGGNKANKNTGPGDVTVNSGTATSTVTNTTTTGGNVAVATCGCNQPGDTTVSITGNGVGSHNGVLVVNKTSNSVSQFNGTLVVNGVLVVQNTGGNHANSNTGGSVDVGSGDATSTVTNTTTTGGNVLAPSTP